MPEPTNAARELAATGTQGPWHTHSPHCYSTADDGLLIFGADCEWPITPAGGEHRDDGVNAADALKITRAVNALGPLGDLLEVVADLLAYGGALEAWDGWPRFEEASDAVEAALRGEG